MPQTVIILTEDALLPTDIEQILAINAEVADEVTYSVLVPTEAEHGVVTAFLNNLWLLDLKEAWEDLTGANDVAERGAPGRGRCPGPIRGGTREGGRRRRLRHGGGRPD